VSAVMPIDESPSSFDTRDDVGAGGQPQRGRAVSEVVLAHPAHACRVAQVAEPLGHVVAVERRPVAVGEHQPVLGVRVAPPLPVGVLPKPLLQQHADHVRVLVDQAVLAAGRLRPAPRHATVTGRAARARVHAADLQQL
jgi:hypothetical protein